MRRRHLIAVIGGVVAWRELIAVKQVEPPRRIGVSLGTSRDDPETAYRVAGLSQGPRAAGWIE
jgi:hypothetical protein